MSENSIKEWLKRASALGEVMKIGAKEAADLKERYDLLMNAVHAESEIQKYIEGQCAEVVTRKLNELLYETAQKKGISLYQLCASVVPEIKPSVKSEPFRVETEITLIPKEYL